MTSSKEIRKEILKMGLASKAAHLGSALSLVEILYTLYFKVANYGKENMHSPDRDKIILSKGHGSAALYAVLNKKSIIPNDAIEKYSVNGGILPCHIDMNAADGFEASAGALGHGIGIAVGMALANKVDKNKGRVYTIIGDGEAQEGSVWEAAELASTRGLDNLTVIVDFNELQASGFSNDIINQKDLSERFRAFGFDAVDVDGHNVEELEKALKAPCSLAGRPKAIIAHTIKGKGVSFMEGTVQSHYTRLNDELYAQAMADVEKM